MTSVALLLVRHAEAARDRDSHRDDWALTARGVVAAQQMAARLANRAIDDVVSSPAARAVATARPLVERLGCNLTIDDRLRERDFGEAWIDDFDGFVERSFANWSSSEGGAESFDACAQRMGGAIADVADASTVVVSHGQAIAAFLATIDPHFGIDDWRALAMPDVIEMHGGVWRSIR